MAILLPIVILIASVVLHELAHGVVAERLGDPTARNAGRLTLNPLKHLDPVGSLLVPLALVVSTGGTFVFGWAKPVPYNPYYFRDRQWGPALVGLAGPLSNVVLALLFGLAIRWGLLYGHVPQLLGGVFVAVVVINLVLAVFNLIPIPPLDGSKLMYALLPRRYIPAYAQLETFGFVVVLGLVYFLGGHVLSRPVMLLFRLITGIS
jgi:Zn-dependent protease